MESVKVGGWVKVVAGREEWKTGLNAICSLFIGWLKELFFFTFFYLVLRLSTLTSGSVSLKGTFFVASNSQLHPPHFPSPHS
jgi:hypothetical protein